MNSKTLVDSCTFTVYPYVRSDGCIQAAEG